MGGRERGTELPLLVLSPWPTVLWLSADSSVSTNPREEYIRARNLLGAGTKKLWKSMKVDPEEQLSGPLMGLVRAVSLPAVASKHLDAPALSADASPLQEDGL